MNQPTTLLDTGPLVAFLANGSDHSLWVTAQWKRLRPPLFTCEAVLAEAAFLLKREKASTDAIFTLMDRGVIQVAMSLHEEWTDVRILMRRYQDRPMSLADACLVRLSELHSRPVVLTFDDDFRIYRRHGNKVIPVLMPEH